MTSLLQFVSSLFSLSRRADTVRQVTASVRAASFGTCLALWALVLGLVGGFGGPQDARAQPFGSGTVIDSAASGVQTIHAADIDGDGKTDVVSGTDGTVAWHHNNGDGSFTTQLIVSANDVRSVYAADVDGDGDTDILSGSDGNQITLHVNDGSSDPSFTSQIVPANADGIQSVYAADVNGDGNTDVLSASRYDDTVAWYENDGTTSFTKRTITTSADGASSVHAADINGDDTTDVVFSSRRDDTVTWYDQTADATTTITTSANRVQDVHASDLDGDGDSDVAVATQYNDLYWYENDGGSGSSFTQYRVDYVGGARDVFAADVNDDGHTDLLAASDDRGVVLYESSGGTSPAFTRQNVDGSASQPQSVSAADVDGDGDTDPLSATSGDNTVSYYENGQILDQVIYVDADATGAGTGSSWADAHTNLQDALPDSTDDGPVEIWVADGTYQPDVGADVELGDRSASFTIRTGTSIYGGFDGTDGQGGGELETQRSQRTVTLDSTGTVLSGDQGESGFRGDDAFHVVTVDGATAIIDGVVVRDGLASGSQPNNSGAGIWVRGGERPDGSLVARNALITNNAASGSGGNGGGVLGGGTFENVTFLGNSANSDGGGVAKGNNSTFTNVAFRDNSAGGKGGGMEGNRSTFTDVTFRNNSADTYEGGGGMYGSGTFTNVTFRNNSASSGRGGGVSIEYGNSAFTSVTFRDNSADEDGGGVYVEGSHITFEDVIFRGNSTGQDGGGIATRYGATVNFTDATFQSNTSEGDGGGIWTGNDDDQSNLLTLKKVTFRGNTAGTRYGGSGGGAYTGGAVRAVNVRFLGNTANDDAGGLYIANSGEPISNAVFSGNQADGNGGALYIDTDSSPKIVNVSFTNNTAQQNGGTIYSTGTNSFPIVANSILWGNSATTGTEIYVNSGQPSVGSSIVEGGLPENVFDDGGNLDQDPLFVNPTGPDGVVGTADDSLQVQDGSPVIDAGDSSELPADSLDLDANGNTTETLPVDLAGNARQQDVVNTSPDGDFAVDMGAYEAEGELPDALADGDVDGSGDVSPNDASMTLQGFLDLITLSPAEQRAADYNSDDAVTPFDASLILQAYLGKRAPAALAKAESGSEGTVRLGDVSVEDGTATIPVMLSGEARRVQSVALNLSYESEVASVKSVTSTVPDGWMTNKNAKDDGSLTVGLAGASPVEGGRTIAEVRLSLSGGADDLSPEGSYRLNGSDTHSLNGTSAPSTPSEFSLEGNYPNPVQRSTTIEYQLAESAPVRITVYDMLGRRIQTLVDTRQEAGTHSVKWNRGGTSRGRVASGTYFYRIEAGDFTETRKMVVVR